MSKTDTEERLIALFDTLNEDGKEELFNYLDYLRSAEKYSKRYTVEKRENNVIFMSRRF